GAVIGSPLYMAPEQVRAEKDLDARADVWAVGATLYEMVTGVAAHMAPTHAAVIARIVTVPAAPMHTQHEDVDASLDAIVLRALSIDRDARFESAAAMRIRLDNYLSGSADTVASLPPVGVSQSSRSSASPQSSGAAPRGNLRVAAIVGFFAVIVIGVLLARPNLTTQSSAAASGSTAPSSSNPSFVAVDAPPITNPSATVSAAPSTLPSDSAAVPFARPATHVETAHSAIISHPPASAHAAASAHLACAAGEQESLGHCCRVGLVWQTDRCDRPLATTAPF
ncbi:MAG: hypothetical protein ABI461_10940, partial [Polyangiaceae bacterium]